MKISYRLLTRANGKSVLEMRRDGKRVKTWWVNRYSDHVEQLRIAADWLEEHGLDAEAARLRAVQPNTMATRRGQLICATCQTPGPFRRGYRPDRWICECGWSQTIS